MILNLGKEVELGRLIFQRINIQINQGQAQTITAASTLKPETNLDSEALNRSSIAERHLETEGRQVQIAFTLTKVKV